MATSSVADRQVVIANGYGKFHLASAAAELARNGPAPHALIGVQLPRRATALIPLLRRSQAGRRLMQRGQASSDLETSVAWLGEPLYHVGRVLGNRAWGRPLSPAAHAAGMAGFGVHARLMTQRMTSGIYHYRAGYGDRSQLRCLRERGVFLLCDHSIAHPQALTKLVRTGRLPAQFTEERLDPLNRRIERDLNAADAIVVNSEFVKETCTWAGMDPGKIHVVYWGVESDVLAAVDAAPPRIERPPERPLRILCAARMERRKGTHVLAEALRLIRPGRVQATLIGDWDPPLGAVRRELAAQGDVILRGHVDRLELARAMTEFDVFVFPSLAEGSARVVGEAMAAGCAVLVTPNTGSFMRPGIDGHIVQPGDAQGLADLILRLDEDREFVAQAGREGAELVRRNYRLSDYASRLRQLYDGVASSGLAGF